MKIGIRYAENGAIETYDKATGEKIGIIETMGNFIEPTEEEKEAAEKRKIEAMKNLDILPY